MKKAFYSLLAALAMTAAVTLGVHAPAGATPLQSTSYEMVAEDVSAMGWPTQCYYLQHNNGAKAECDKSNGGSYKASVNCIPFDGGGMISRDAGVWRTDGISFVSCPPRTAFHSAGIWTRASS